jgi:hypothetical protein
MHPGDEVQPRCGDRRDGGRECPRYGAKPTLFNPRSPSSRTTATVDPADPPAYAQRRSQTSRLISGKINAVDQSVIGTGPAVRSPVSSLAGMDFFARSKDLLAIGIAVVAVILSVVTVLIQRRQQREHAFQQIHEILMTPEHQHGRWLMWTIAESGRLPDQGSPDYYLINRTLGMLDLLAQYAREGVVPRRWVLERWHHPLQQMAVAVRLLVDERVAVARWRPWPDLGWLIRETATYRSSLGCCLPAEPPPKAKVPIAPPG